jgi:hypothetical protein
MTRILLLALLLAVAGMTGCAAPQISAPFPGMRSLLPAQQQCDDAEARLFIVHAITAHPPRYADKLVASLAARLSLEVATPEDRQVPIPGSVGADGGPASINLRTFSLRDRARERVRVMAVTWSALTATLKHRRFAVDDAVERAAVNGYVKRHIVSDGLGDAVLYVGTYQPVMRDALALALCDFLGGRWQQGRCDAAPPGAPIGFISHSLGSMMLFDAIEELRAQPAAGAVGAALAQTRLFFMFANQLPLLELSTVRPASVAAAAAPPSGGRLQRFLREMAGPAAALPRSSAASPPQPRLHVVAFTDPSDLLSYRLQDADVHTGVAISNVTYPVATRWLGLFADPVEAHAGYEKDATIIDLVICGSGGC